MPCVLPKETSRSQQQGRGEKVISPVQVQIEVAQVQLSRWEPVAEEHRAEQSCTSPPMALSSLEPSPASPQQESVPCRGMEEDPASLGQELRESCSSTSCSSSSEDSDSSLEYVSTPPPGTSCTGEETHWGVGGLRAIHSVKPVRPSVGLCRGKRKARGLSCTILLALCPDMASLGIR